MKLDGSVKTKGFFAKAGLAKSPQNEVCVDAVITYLSSGIPVETTVYACNDIRKFITVRQVSGGAEKDGLLVGKAIRWYYSTTVKGVIRYVTNGNVVSRSAGARHCMDLPDHIPSDLDREWYVEEARGLLMDVGAIPRPPKPKLPRRNTKAWKSLAEQGAVEVDDYGKPQWAIPLSEIPKEYQR